MRASLSVTSWHTPPEAIGKAASDGITMCSFSEHHWMTLPVLKKPSFQIGTSDTLLRRVLLS